MQGSGSGSAVPSLSWQNRPGFPRAPDLAVLDPIAGLQNEQDIGGDHANHDKHPVLDLEAQNGEMLDQKLHRFRPLFGQDKRFDGRNILFLYFQKIPADSLCRPSSGVAVLSRHRRCTGNTANSPSRAECKQPVELGRVIPNAVGACDEDLPTLVSQSPSLGDSDRDAQPNRRRDIFTSRRMHHEGHGNTLFVQRPILWSIAISIPAAEHEARSTVRNELPNRRPWIIRSGNLPGPAFQPHRPLDMTGSRLPTI